MIAHPVIRVVQVAKASTNEALEIMAGVALDLIYEKHPHKKPSKGFFGRERKEKHQNIRYMPLQYTLESISRHRQNGNDNLALVQLNELTSLGDDILLKKMMHFATEVNDNQMQVETSETATNNQNHEIALMLYGQIGLDYAMIALQRQRTAPLEAIQLYTRALEVVNGCPLNAFGIELNNHVRIIANSFVGEILIDAGHLQKGAQYLLTATQFDLVRPNQAAEESQRRAKEILHVLANMQ
jgi:hypothetical protein